MTNFNTMFVLAAMLLGSAATANAAAEGSPDSAAPGPYASWLIHNGMPRDAALRSARAIDQGQANAFARYTRTADGKMITVACMPTEAIKQ